MQFRVALVMLGLFALLCSCNQVFDTPFKTKPLSGRVTVDVVLLPKGVDAPCREVINTTSPFIMGCYIPPAEANGYVGKIYAPMPETFNDDAATVLGHELLHALGAQHN